MSYSDRRMMPRARKKFSQNWLIDQTVVEKIIEAAEIRAGERVLEIGPGTGVLTEALVNTGARVMAVEADKSLIGPLKEKFGKKIELVCNDILSYGRTITRPYKLVANLPYHITSDVLRMFLTHPEPPIRMVLMVQREVADRMMSIPPHMSLLSVMCQLYATCKKVVNVPRGAFRPIPKVDSAVVRLDYQDPSVYGLDPEQVVRIAKQGFLARRKQLHKNLSALPGIDGEQVKKWLTELGIDAKSRAENLTVDDWVGLTHKILQK